MTAGRKPARGEALLVGMPMRYLLEAARISEASGTSVLPAGAAGDLHRTEPGTEVLFVVSEAGENEVPAATWTAEFVGTVPADRDGYPERLPQSWLDDRKAPSPAPAATQRSPFGGEETDERASEHGAQHYFEVRSLAELPAAAWIFVNELVPKQERRGRTFFPRAPRLVERPS